MKAARHPREYHYVCTHLWKLETYALDLQRSLAETLFCRYRNILEH